MRKSPRQAWVVALSSGMPRPTFLKLLVVKNGSWTFCRVWRSMPLPSSATSRVRLSRASDSAMSRRMERAPAATEFCTRSIRWKQRSSTIGSRGEDLERARARRGHQRRQRGGRRREDRARPPDVLQIMGVGVAQQGVAAEAGERAQNVLSGRLAGDLQRRAVEFGRHHAQVDQQPVGRRLDMGGDGDAVV